MKKNCWEFMKCGRQYGGKESGGSPCPASTTIRLDTVHGGKNAGRACWVIAGSMSGQAPVGKFTIINGNCSNCQFYLTVREEEGEGFIFAPTLLAKRILPAMELAEAEKKKDKKK